ncbi:MAG: IS30 family transposase [Candidatus Nanopelagicales bacterium]
MCPTATALWPSGRPGHRDHPAARGAARSLTWDQGKELMNHAAITAATRLHIYFCDPKSPWQRASNENTNGLLRQYLPKGSDLSFYGPGLLDSIAAELNGRPPQEHAFRTPAEVLDELLSQAANHHGVA